MDDYSRLEKRIERLEDKHTIMIQELASFKPILETLCENVKKIGANTIDKQRVEKLENKVEQLETELQNETIKKDAEKWNKAIWVLISGSLTAIVGFVIGKII